MATFANKILTMATLVSANKILTMATLVSAKSANTDYPLAPAWCFVQCTGVHGDVDLNFGSFAGSHTLIVCNSSWYIHGV